MDQASYRLEMIGADKGTATALAGRLAVALRAIPGVVNIERQRSETSNLDLGSIIELVATPVAIAAVGHLVAGMWKQTKGGITIKITKDRGSKSMKYAIDLTLGMTTNGPVVEHDQVATKSCPDS